MKNRWDWPSRLKAAGTHLGLSLLVALAAAALVLGVWYPMPYREVSGGRELFSLIVSVDVVLGPLITLAVFDKAKSWAALRRDLMVIALLQLGALSYGLHTVWVARPVYLVHEVDLFRVVRAVDLEPEQLTKASPGFQKLPWDGPRVIGTRGPRDLAETMRSMDLALQGRDISFQPEFWIPYAEARSAVLKRAKPLAELQKRNPTHAAEIDALAARAGRPLAQLGYLPLISLKEGWVVVVDSQTADVVGSAPFDGFEAAGKGVDAQKKDQAPKAS